MWSAQIRLSFSLRDVSGTESRGRPRTRGRDRGAVRLRLASAGDFTRSWRAGILPAVIERLARSLCWGFAERDARRMRTGRPRSFNLGEHAQEIAAEDFLDLGIGEAALEQTFGEAGESCRRLQIGGQRRDTIEVATDADMFDARHLRRMQNMVDHILELRRRAAESAEP